MTAFTNLSIADGAATPVTRTFNKVKLGDGNDANSMMATWEDRESGFQVGFNTISQMQRFPSKNLRSTKVQVKITAPIMEVVATSTVSGIAPAPTVAYKPLATIECVLPERSSKEARDNLYAFLKGFMLSNEFKNAVTLLDPIN